jgi:hypothetical protein
LHKERNLKDANVPVAFKGWLVLADKLSSKGKMELFIVASYPLEKGETIDKALQEINCKTRFAEFLYDRLDLNVAVNLLLAEIKEVLW